MLNYNKSWDTVIDVKKAIYGFNRVCYRTMLIYIQAGLGRLSTWESRR